MRQGEGKGLGGEKQNCLRRGQFVAVVLHQDAAIEIGVHQSPRPSEMISLAGFPGAGSGKCLSNRVRRSGHSTFLFLFGGGTRVAKTLPRFRISIFSPSSIHWETRAKWLRRSATVATFMIPKLS